MRLASRARCPFGRLVSRASRLIVLGSKAFLSQMQGCCACSSETKGKRGVREDRGSGPKPSRCEDDWGVRGGEGCFAMVERHAKHLSQRNRERQ